MANNSTKTVANDTSSSWESFRMPAGGTARDIRKSVAELRDNISQDKKAFSGSHWHLTAAKNKR